MLPSLWLFCSRLLTASGASFVIALRLLAAMLSRASFMLAVMLGLWECRIDCTTGYQRLLTGSAVPIVAAASSAIALIVHSRAVTIGSGEANEVLGKCSYELPSGFRGA